MTRDMRFRFAGTFFYVFFLANILVAPGGWDSLKGLFDLTGDSAGTVVSILALGAALLTSDVLGYFFGTVVWEVFRLFGGFPTTWAALRVKKIVVDAISDKKLKGRLDTICDDAYFSYFWQQAPEGCVDWASRKHVTFFANWSVVAAILAAYLCSAMVLRTLQLRWCRGHLAIVIAAAITMGLLIVNGLLNWREMKHMVKLHFLARGRNDVRDALRKVDALLMGDGSQTTPSPPGDSSPSR